MMMSYCLSVCLSVCVSLSARVYVCLFVYLSHRPPEWTRGPRSGATTGVPNVSFSVNPPMKFSGHRRVAVATCNWVRDCSRSLKMAQTMYDFLLTDNYLARFRVIWRQIMS